MILNSCGFLFTRKIFETPWEQRDRIQGSCANDFRMGFVECIDQCDEATNLVALLKNGGDIWQVKFQRDI